MRTKSCIESYRSNSKMASCPQQTTKQPLRETETRMRDLGGHLRT